MQSGALEHRVPLVLANVTLFNLEFVQQKLIFFLYHKVVLIIVGIIL
jgi:hypothetical protein